MGKVKFSEAAREFAQNLQVVSSSCNLSQADVHDDLKRENSFLAQALEAAVKAKNLLAELGFGFGAPEGYFCETLKTEEQMNKIKKRVDAKVEANKAAEEARKQRHLKKFGKKVQTETLMERAKKKKEDLAKIAQMRKRRKTAGGADEFDIEVDSDDGGAQMMTKKKVIKDGKRTTVDRKVGAKRDYKNQKFGFGGKKWDKKKNTRDSTDDFEFNPARNKRGFAGSKQHKGGKGGAAAKRPGKQRRQQMRSKTFNKRK